jgi:hypothetical protein
MSINRAKSTKKANFRVKNIPVKLNPYGFKQGRFIFNLEDEWSSVVNKAFARRNNKITNNNIIKFL